MANHYHRDRKLLDLAHRLHNCTARIPGVCQGYSVHGLEPAHSNQHQHGKGAGIKAHDHWHAALCHACHVELDQGRALSRDEKAEVWQRAHIETMNQYWGNGWIKVA